MPVSSTAILAGGMRCLLMAEAAAKKDFINCLFWADVANFCCASLTSASVSACRAVYNISLVFFMVSSMKSIWPAAPERTRETGQSFYLVLQKCNSVK